MKAELKFLDEEAVKMEFAQLHLEARYYVEKIQVDCVEKVLAEAKLELEDWKKKVQQLKTQHEQKAEEFDKVYWPLSEQLFRHFIISFLGHRKIPERAERDIGARGNVFGMAKKESD